MHVASGNCGSQTLSAAQARLVRRRESRRAARILGAHWHPPLGDDLEVLYDLRWLRRLAAVIRRVQPDVVLTHPPVDYMEDHTNTCRLAVTAAFARGMPNFRTLPQRPHFEADTTVYHCTPHGLCDPLGQPMRPALFVDTTDVHAQKLQALAAHASQRSWLQASQGLDAMSAFAEQEARQLGRWSRKFRYAEGWWRHSPLGFCAADADPLRTALGVRYCRPRNRTVNIEKGN